MRIIWGVLVHAYWTFWTTQLAYVGRFDAYESRHMMYAYYPKY